MISLTLPFEIRVKNGRDVGTHNLAGPGTDRVENGLYGCRHRSQAIVLLPLDSTEAMGVTKEWLQRVDAQQNVQY